MAAFQQLMKLLPAVAGGELLKIDGGGAVGDVGNAGACVSKHSTDRIAHIPKVTTFVPPRAGTRLHYLSVIPILTPVSDINGYKYPVTA